MMMPLNATPAPWGIGDSLGGLTPAQRDAYHARLFTSHDFRVEVDVLTLDEKPIGSLRFLDGQVNLVADADVRRTCSLTISDPDGALDFAGASTFSSGTVWANRLVRVRHLLDVPGVGTVTAVPFIGPPSTIARNGDEVDLELQDKTALAMRGCPPLQLGKGMPAGDAIATILYQRTGETHIRFPASTRRLSKDYSTGWDDSVSPWKVCQQIASRELGMLLTYSCDGYALLRYRPTVPVLTTSTVTASAVSSVDFSTLYNWVRADGSPFTVTKGTKVTTATVHATATLAESDPFSLSSMKRNGVPIYAPMIVTDSGARYFSQVKDKAEATLAANDRLKREQSFSCVPFFHLDADDVIRFSVPSGSVDVSLGDCSIPLGVSGDMTVGTHAWVSKPPGVRSSVWLTKHHTYKKPKKKSTTKHKPTNHYTAVTR